MSFIVYPVQCRRCDWSGQTSFGMVGMTQIAVPVTECPRCTAPVERVPVPVPVPAPPPAPPATTAEQELQAFLSGLPAAHNISQWLLGWRARAAREGWQAGRDAAAALIQRDSKCTRCGFHECAGICDNACAAAAAMRALAPP